MGGAARGHQATLGHLSYIEKERTIPEDKKSLIPSFGGEGIGVAVRSPVH